MIEICQEPAQSLGKKSVADNVIDRLIPTKDLGFGKYFCRTALVANYSDGVWQKPVISELKNFQLHPAAKVFHYSQEIFEGMKAYLHPDGSVALFRPQANIARMAHSSRMLHMPVYPEDLFLESLKVLVRKHLDMVPKDPGSLYIRPTMIGTTPVLGVGAASDYSFFIMLSPVGGYFGDVPSDKPVGIRVKVSESRIRAAPGGVGSAKTGGNYAASLAVLAETKAAGFNEAMFLDARDKKYIEELSGMNIMVVVDGVLKTPPLGDTILAGVTRDSILKIARSRNVPVNEERLDINEVIAGIRQGRVSEIFACGTAAVITSIKELSYRGELTQVGSGQAGPIGTRLYQDLTAIQNGRIAPPDPSWIVKI